jgi:hypothetical protein
MNNIMTKPVVGKVITNLHNDLAHVCYEDEKLLAKAAADLIDGDNDTSEAQRIINDMRTRNVARFALHEKVIRGETASAETDAMTLATNNKNSIAP